LSYELAPGEEKVSVENRSGKTKGITKVFGRTLSLLSVAHGQYVLADQGEAIYGVWFVFRDELEALFRDRPIIVSGGSARAKSE
jgi:hypothetical protein